MSMPMIQDACIEAVRDAADIVQILSEYLPGLKKSGREWRAPCPFHGEKEPSFYVNPTKGVYFCFGCKASGGVFNFIMAIEGCTYPEAVSKVADRVGVQVEYAYSDPDEKKRKKERDRSLSLTTISQKWFREQLQTDAGRDAVAYLHSRGVTSEAVDAFGLGFAPPGWDNLVTFLSKKGYKDFEIVSVGLAAERPKPRGGIYDFLRDGIVFPIYNRHGKPVAFGRRRSEHDEDGPKYLNTPNSSIFKKENTLYGYSQCRKGIQDSKEVLVVEGYLDVLALWVAGFHNVVAPMGTALTESHLKLLGRGVATMFLAFDADRAGVEAAAKVWEYVRRPVRDIRVVRMPKGHDPCSMMQEARQDEFEKALAEAMPLQEFVCLYRIKSAPADSIIQQQEAVRACASVFQKLDGDDNEPLRAALGKKLIGWTGFPASTVKSLVKGDPKPVSFEAKSRDSSPGYNQVELDSLRFILSDPAYVTEYVAIGEEAFSEEAFGAIWNELKELSYSADFAECFDSTVSRIVEGLEDDAKAAVGELLCSSPAIMPDPKRVFLELEIKEFEALERQADAELQMITDIEPLKKERQQKKLQEYVGYRKKLEQRRRLAV